MSAVRQWLHKEAEKAGIPLRTAQDCSEALAECRDDAARKSMRRLMLNHGRLTSAARTWLEANE